MISSKDPTSSSPHNSNKRAEIPSLYALKALCALFVVIIHTNMIGKEALSPLVRIAVPVFYIITGYFLYTGNAENECAKAWKWTKKAFFLALGLNIIYFFFSSFTSGEWQTRTYRGLIRAVITGTDFAEHLWYLTALWEALIAFIILRKYFAQLLPYCIPLIALNLILGRYYFIIDPSPYPLETAIRLNFLAVALPCLITGYCIRRWEKRILQIRHPAVYMLLFLLLLYAETSILNYLEINNNVSYCIFTLPLAVTFFICFLRSSINIPQSIVTLGKYHSANIYYYHAIIIGLLTYIPIASTYYSTVGSLIVFVLTALLSYIILLIGRIVGRSKHST